MLQRVGIKDGIGELKGYGRHLKIVSAETELRVAALDSNGRPIKETYIRAPMATVFNETAATLFFFSDTAQTVEVWYGMEPLEYLQLVAVGATRMKSSKKIVPGNISTKLLDATPRTKLKMRTDSNIKISSTPDEGGWTVFADTQETLETSGELWVIGKGEYFDYTSLSGAASVLLADANYTAQYESNDRWEYFKKTGAFYACPQTLSDVKEVLKDGTVNTLPMPGTPVKEFLGKLWQVRFSGSRRFMVSSTDARIWVNEFELPSDCVDIFTQTSLRIKIAESWLIYTGEGTKAADSVACNLVTGECLRSPTGQTSAHQPIYWPKINKWLSVKVGNASDAGIFAFEGGEWVRKLAASHDYRGVIFDDLGRCFAHNSNNLYRIFDDFSRELIITGIGNSVEYINGSGGILFWSFGGQMGFYREGIDSGLISVSSAGTSFAKYDSEDEKIYFIQAGGALDIAIKERDAPNLPKTELFSVEMLEFLV
ncbi:hypothetical protein ORI99_01825 [Alishewanella sp. SMS9]|nr:hypothetical protein [Alishewanella sp. SMS9]